MQTLPKIFLISICCLASGTAGAESISQPWRYRFDIGGTIPENPTLSMISGPVTAGNEMKLTAGSTFDLGIGYQATPWLLLEGSLGFTYNGIDAVGNWAYPNSSLTQMPIMFNVEFCVPRGPLVPFAGFGVGGVWSQLSFGNYYYSYYYYYYSDSAGHASDFVAAAQVFAGLRYEFDSNWNIGVVYRFLATDSQHWDVDWWNGADFQIGVDRVCIHSICLTVSGRF